MVGGRPRSFPGVAGPGLLQFVCRFASDGASGYPSDHRSLGGWSHLFIFCSSNVCGQTIGAFLPLFELVAFVRDAGQVVAFPF